MREQMPARWMNSIAPDFTPVVERTAPVLGILTGEGVGPEVIGATLRVLDALEAVTPLRTGRRFGGDIGLRACADGQLTDDVAAFCRRVFDEGGALLCGPGGGRFVYDLRHRFNLFCKIVPIIPCAALQRATRFHPDLVKRIDILVLRDNAGGVYQGRWSERACDINGTVAEHQFSYSETQVRQIVEVGARLAKQRRGRLDVVIKDGGLPSISALWRRIAQRVATTERVACGFLNADFAAYQMIQHPHTLDVLVAPNLVGDILADLGAVFLASRGMSYSGNFSSTGFAAYQTGHGGAHDLTNTDRANPIAQILSLAMLLHESFGRATEARLITRAVEHVLESGWRTPDLAQEGCRIVGTQRMGDLIAEAVAGAAPRAVAS